MIEGRIVSALAFGLMSMPAYAHSGGLNSLGCHSGSKPYHCHRSPNEMVRTASGRNRLRCDLGSRSIECRKPYQQSYSFNSQLAADQRKLMRHCTGTPSKFVDGRLGPLTRSVVRSFQNSYGLDVDGVIGPETRSALSGPVKHVCRY